jgi:hypothetical protein
MEFQYYYDQSKLAPELLLYLTEYPSSVGDFTSNDLPSTAEGNTHNNIPNESTVFFTYSKPSNRNTFLMSRRMVNFSGGWVLGIDDNNHLFIEVFGPFETQSHRFNITLGKKNCLAIKQVGNYFTVYRYDIYSKKIYEKQTVLFNGNVNLTLSNNNLNVGWESGITTYYSRNISINPNYTFFKPFNGVFDQYVIIGAALDDYYIEYLFQGFCPETITNYQTSVAEILSTNVRQPGMVKLTNNFVDMFKAGATGFAGFLLDYNPSAGTYNSYFTGVVGYGYNAGTPTLPGGISSFQKHFVTSGFNNQYCMKSDAILYSPTITLNSPLNTGPTGKFDFSGNTRIARDIEDKVYFTHQIEIKSPSLFGTGKTVLTLDYIYQIKTFETGILDSIDSGYYSAFYMEGITAPQSYGSTILGTIQDTYFDKMNLIGRYNLATGQFRVENSGRMYFNGQLLNPADYSIINNYIDIVPFNEQSTDYLIYDNTNNYMDLIQLSLTCSATGLYRPGCSIGFTGINSYGPFRRDFKDNFLETVSYHSYHDIDIANVNNIIG